MTDQRKREILSNLDDIEIQKENGFYVNLMKSLKIQRDLEMMLEKAKTEEIREEIQRLLNGIENIVEIRYPICVASLVSPETVGKINKYKYTDRANDVDLEGKLEVLEKKLERSASLNASDPLFKKVSEAISRSERIDKFVYEEFMDAVGSSSEKRQKYDELISLETRKAYGKLEESIQEENRQKFEKIFEKTKAVPPAGTTVNYTYITNTFNYQTSQVPPAYNPEIANQIPPSYESLSNDIYSNNKNELQQNNYVPKHAPVTMKVAPRDKEKAKKIKNAIKKVGAKIVKNKDVVITGVLIATLLIGAQHIGKYGEPPEVKGPDVGIENQTGVEVSDTFEGVNIVDSSELQNPNFGVQAENPNEKYEALVDRMSAEEIDYIYSQYGHIDNLEENAKRREVKKAYVSLMNEYEDSIMNNKGHAVAGDMYKFVKALLKFDIAESLENAGYDDIHPDDVLFRKTSSGYSISIKGEGDVASKASDGSQTLDKFDQIVIVQEWIRDNWIEMGENPGNLNLERSKQLTDMVKFISSYISERENNELQFSKTDEGRYGEFITFAQKAQTRDIEIE